MEIPKILQILLSPNQQNIHKKQEYEIQITQTMINNFNYYWLIISDFVIRFQQNQYSLRGMSGEKFTKLGLLGQGAFGTVYKVIRHEDQQCYAMKKVKIMEMKEKDKRNALNQVRLLASVSHPNIVNYCEAFYDQKEMCLCTVMQLAQNGDLASHIKSKIAKKDHFYEYEIWRIANDIFSGIQALHEKKIIHRDIKPANIFFGKHHIAKIGDMNVSLAMKSNLAYTQIGTPFYASPEIWNDQPYSYECDIWSLGCVLYEMCCLKRPFEAPDMDKLYYKIKKCQYDPIPLRFSEELSNLINRCLSLRRSRIRNSELREIFDKKIHPKQQYSIGQLQLDQINNPQMVETIKLPVFARQFSKCLPKANYESEKIKFILGNQNQSGQDEQEQYEILNQFLKPKSFLQNKKESERVTKSHKILPASRNMSYLDGQCETRKKSYLNKDPSFHRAINIFSPRKNSNNDLSINLINMRRKRTRQAMYGC